MLNFFSTVAASAVGFVVAKFVTAWFDSHVSKASYLEAERNQDSENVRKTIENTSLKAMDYWSRDQHSDDQREEAEALPVGMSQSVSILIDELFGVLCISFLHDACSVELAALKREHFRRLALVKAMSGEPKDTGHPTCGETVSSMVKQSKIDANSNPNGLETGPYGSDASLKLRVKTSLLSAD